MNNHIFVKGAIALTVFALVGGCGSSETSQPSPAKTLRPPPVAASKLTKAQYIRQGNAICRNGYNTLIKSFAPIAKQELSTDERERYAVNALLPPFKRMIAHLRALGAPAGDKARIEEMLFAYEKAIAEVEADPARMHTGKLPFDAGNNRAWRYGLTYCRA